MSPHVIVRAGHSFLFGAWGNMTKEVFDSGRIRQVLMRRFSVAAAILAVTCIVSIGLVGWRMRNQTNDAHLINLSGRQRMLSQRTGLLVTLALHPTASVDRSEAQLRLTKAAEEMRAAHRELFADRIGSAKRTELFEGPRGIDQRLRAYLDSLVRLNDWTPEDQKRLQRDIVRGELLAQLHSVVQQYEKEYDQKMVASYAIQLAMLAVMLIVLAITFGVFIHPLTRLITRTLESLERSNSELLEFSYRISHDLRSPVVSALGIATMARDALRDGDQETTAMSLDHVHTSLTKVSGTIEDIVSLVKQKMVNVESETFRIGELVQDALESIRHMPGFDAIRLELNLSDDLSVRGKKLYVRQTLENLLSNAVKYQDPKVDQPKIEVDADVRGGRCNLSVADNGLGIEPTYRDRMFAMFQRFHPDAAFGTGLGLYLVKQNALALGGDVQYHPLTKGSRFSLSFPCEAQP